MMPEPASTVRAVARPPSSSRQASETREVPPLSAEPRRASLNLLGAWLAGWSRPALVALTFGSLTLVGLIDYFTGYELSVLIFYLLPVSLAAWFVNRRLAMGISFISVCIWIAGDVGAGATYPNKIILAWNATIILGFFLVVAFLLDGLRTSILALESRVQQRTAALTEEMAERDRLEKEVLEISEREQRRIGHDLHDGLGQHLTATALASQVLEDHLAAQKLVPETREAERIVELIEQSIELTRSLARGLSPVAVETEGLSIALVELAAQTTAQFYLPCDVYCEPSLHFTDPVAAMHLYRIAQESISNAVRHGHANRVDISLIREDEGRLRLTIRDDGRGLPLAEVRRREGQGLRIMSHRARMIGATLDIFPAEDRGTIVRCSLALPTQAEATPPTIA